MKSLCLAYYMYLQFSRSITIRWSAINQNIRFFQSFYQQSILNNEYQFMSEQIKNGFREIRNLRFHERRWQSDRTGVNRGKQLIRRWKTKQPWISANNREDSISQVRIYRPFIRATLTDHNLWSITYGAYKNEFRAELDYYKTHFRRFECSMDQAKIVTLDPSFFEFDQNKVGCCS